MYNTAVYLPAVVERTEKECVKITLLGSPPQNRFLVPRMVEFDTGVDKAKVRLQPV